MRKLLLTSLLTTTIASASQAQVVSGSAFLKGNFVEIGIDGNGGFEGAPWDASTPPVAGMHFRSGNPFFGFVANPQMDGWVDYNGDFFTPGSPENGWGIEIIDAGGIDITAENNCSYVVDIPGSITSYSHTGGVQTAVWEGDFDSSVYSLHITITYTLADSALDYLTNVSITNMGDDIDEFYYYRNIDPDNNEPISSDFTTTNTIVAQGGPGSPLADVKAESSVPWYSVFEISAADSMARVSVGGFSNRDGSDIWNGTGGLNGTLYYSNFADEAVSMATKMNNLTFGRAAHDFTFRTSFGNSSITTGLHEQAKTNLSVYPNPTNGMLNIRSNDPVLAVSVYNAAGVLQFQSSNMSTVDLSAYASGLYLVKIKTSKETLVKHIVKN